MKRKQTYTRQGKLLMGALGLALILLMGFLIFAILPKEQETEVPLGTIHSGVDIAPSETPLDELTFMVIDVGQGQSIFIDYNDMEILIDAGSYNEGSRTVSDAIKEYVDGPIEYVIGTHSHEDHIGGMSQIYDNFKVKTTIYGDLEENSWCDIFKRKAYDAGKFINDTNTTIELGPKTTLTIYDVTDDAENTNNNSVVCLLEHGNNSFYMSGDLEAESEITLRKTITDVNVAVLSHHGSDTSNSNLDVLHPEISLISCSKDNDYGHPSKSILEEALSYGRVFATFKSGTMTLTSDGNDISYSMNDADTLDEDDYGKGKKGEKEN